MQVVLTVSSSKYTGAAAVAELWCRALHSVGVNAQLLCVRGDNLEEKLGSEPWGAPALYKERRPFHIRHNLSVLRHFAEKSDVMVTFLPHDHFETVVAGAHKRTCLVRAFRRPRHLRPDPLHRWFSRRARAALSPFSALTQSTRRYMSNKPVEAIEVPVEDRFSPASEASNVRDELSASKDLPIVGMVGKLAADRGFDLLIDAAARMSSEARLLIVGHGEFQPKLESQARTLGLQDRIHWAGKRETDLPDLYRAMDVVVFAAPGSDWGHRAISEAQACGRPVVAVDHPGVEDLVHHGRTGTITEEEPTSIAHAIDELLGNPEKTRRIIEAAVRTSESRRFLPVANRLAAFLEDAAAAPC